MQLGPDVSFLPLFVETSGYIQHCARSIRAPVCGKLSRRTLLARRDIDHGAEIKPTMVVRFDVVCGQDTATELDYHKGCAPPGDSPR